MFVTKDVSGVKLYANRATDPIDWREACPGGLVIQLPAAGYQQAFDWVNAGHYTGAVAPEPLPDADGRAPDAEGWIDTYTEGTPDTWQLIGNTVAVADDGTIELRDPAGVVTVTLAGEVIQTPEASA